MGGKPIRYSLQKETVEKEQQRLWDWKISRKRMNIWQWEFSICQTLAPGHRLMHKGPNSTTQTCDNLSDIDTVHFLTWILRWQNQEQVFNFQFRAIFKKKKLLLFYSSIKRKFTYSFYALYKDVMEHFIVCCRFFPTVWFLYLYLNFLLEYRRIFFLINTCINNKATLKNPMFSALYIMQYVQIECSVHSLFENHKIPSL